MAEAAFVAASVIPLVLLVAVLGAGFLPIRDVVRLVIVDSNPGSLPEAMAALQNDYPGVTVDHRALDEAATDVIVRRELSLRPGGEPSITVVGDYFAKSGHISEISTDLELQNTRLSGTHIVVAYGIAMFGAMALLSAWLLLMYPVAAAVSPALIDARAAGLVLIAWAAVSTVGWGSTFLPDLWWSAVNPDSLETTLVGAGFGGVLLACVVAPVGEELLFRRWLYAGLLQDRVVGANLIQSALFAVPHAPLFGLRGALAAMVAAMVFGWLYRRTGLVAAPIIAHAGYNGSVLASHHVF